MTPLISRTLLIWLIIALPAFGTAAMAAAVHAKPAAKAASISRHRDADRRCLALQRAMLTPLNRYGGYVPSNAPALVQQMINPMLDVIRTRCLPYHRPPDD